VIQTGELVAQGTEGELAQRFGGGGAVEVELKGSAERARSALEKVSGVGAVRILAEAGELLTLRVEGAAELRPAIVRALVAAELDVLRIDKGAERLESIFLKLTHGKEAA
jgi:ABC-2 type transport system ATP-binding protein